MIKNIEGLGREHVTWLELIDANKIPNSFNDICAGGNMHCVPEAAKALKHT